MYLYGIAHVIVLACGWFLPCTIAHWLCPGSTIYSEVLKWLENFS